MILLTASRSDKIVDRGRESLTAADTVFQEAAPRRILLVEDNDLNRQMLDDYLVFCGYQVLSIAGGYDFFQVLADFKPHLVLLDLRLPDIDGYTLLQQIQQGSDWQHIPVIVVSAFAFRVDQQRALSLGVRRYFVKPVILTDLRQAIQDELHGRVA